MFDFITKIGKCFIKDIEKNVSTEVPDMRIVVNCRTASIKTNESFMNWFEIL